MAKYEAKHAFVPIYVNVGMYIRVGHNRVFGGSFWHREGLLRCTMTLLQGPKDPVLPNLTYMITNQCKFGNPFFTGCNLRGANLEGSQMAGVNLRVATLKDANMQNCDLRSAVLAGADLEVK